MKDRTQYLHDYNVAKYAKLQAIYADKAPLCACGCGEKVKWSPRLKGYATYLFNHKNVRIADVELTDRQLQIIRGTVLGDGCIQILKNRTTGKETGMGRLRIRHSPKRQTDYIKWKRTELDNLCSSDIKTIDNAGYGSKTSSFNTLSHPKIYEIGKSIYSENGKTITRDYLDKIDDLGLAVWFMDDGNKASISTHCFSIEEHHIMVKWFKEKWNLDYFIDYDKRVVLPFLRTRQPNITQLYNIIGKHILPSLSYKFRESHMRAIYD